MLPEVFPTNRKLVAVGTIALTLPAGLPYEEWEELGIRLQWAERSLPWLLGDWLNYGEREYGEKYAQAVEELPYAYQTLANYAWVCRVFPPEERRRDLAFGHHAEVASMKELENRERLLAEAIDEHLSCRELRDRKKETLGKPARVPKALPAEAPTQADPDPPREFVSFPEPDPAPAGAVLAAEGKQAQNAGASLEIPGRILPPDEGVRLLVEGMLDFLTEQGWKVGPPLVRDVGAHLRNRMREARLAVVRRAKE